MFFPFFKNRTGPGFYTAYIEKTSLFSQTRKCSEDKIHVARCIFIPSWRQVYFICSNIHSYQIHIVLLQIIKLWSDGCLLTMITSVYTGSYYCQYLIKYFIQSTLLTERNLVLTEKMSSFYKRRKCREKTSFINRKEMLGICSSINSYQMFNVLFYILIEILINYEW